MIGAPGSGKGTQGAFLEEKIGFKTYVMSDLIRAQLHEGSPLREKMNKGVLIDDGDIFRIFREGFAKEKRVIVDGLPRTLDQSYWLFGFLKRKHYNIKVLFIEVDEDNLLTRVGARRFCSKCNSGYNNIFMKPKVENICDKCGGDLIQRTDDKLEVFKDRLEIFADLKLAVLDVFSSSVIKINGDQAIDVVKKEMFEMLNIE